MATNNDFPHFISTDQKVLLSDWTVMAKLIFKHSALLKDGGYDEEAFNNEPTHILSDQQFDNAFRGPYAAFLRDKIRAFATLCRLRMASHIQNEDSLKDHLNTLHPELQLQADVTEQFDREHIKDAQDKLDTLVADHNQQWEGQLFFWQTSIISALNDAKLGANANDTDEFSAAEPLSELFERYQNYNIDLPKVTFPLSFHDYFMMKAKLMILNALSRQQLPHDNKQIQSFMSKLKKPLAEISNAEMKLLETQRKKTIEALADIQFAALAR